MAKSYRASCIQFLVAVFFFPENTTTVIHKDRGRVKAATKGFPDVRFTTPRNVNCGSICHMKKNDMNIIVNTDILPGTAGVPHRRTPP